MTKSAIVAIIFAVVLSGTGTAHANTDLSTLVKFGAGSGGSNVSTTKSGNQKAGVFDIGARDFVEGEVLVKFDAAHIIQSLLQGTSPEEQLAGLLSLDLTQIFNPSGFSIFNIVGSSTVEDMVAQLKTNPAISFAEPNYRRYPAEISTDDTHKDLLWALDNTEQTVGGTYTTGNPGTADSDIDAPEAWTINEGTTTPIIVAIIDDGVAYNHPDLIGSMWDGSQCKDENGNFIGECNHGYDFVDNDKTPLSSDIHGTHIAATIAATKNNAAGGIGVAPHAKIMAIRFGYEVVSEVKAIDFARVNGAKIINASFGGSTFSQAEKDAIQRFKDAGGIFVAAAGNDGVNNDITETATYPASHNLSNIISVAASDQTDALTPFTNFGATSTDIAAPGTNIFGAKPSETTRIDEAFETANTPNLPEGWTKGGEVGNNWGTYDLLDDTEDEGVVLYSDVNRPYANNASTSVLSPTFDLSGSAGAMVSFDTRCDTEYSIALWIDRMELSSTDGATTIRMAQWDEVSLDNDSEEDGPSPIRHIELPIPPTHLKDGVRLDFHWVTDDSDNDYDACFVDNVEVKKFSDGSDAQYGYMNGTSVAAPFVSGAAALLAGYNPNLTVDQIKNAILTNGDPIESHEGKTVTGKRLNLLNALVSVLPPKKITSFTILGQDGATVINETAHTISISMPFGTDLTTLTPTIVIDGVSVSPASNVPQDFTSPVTYTVTASDNRTQAYTVTVSHAGFVDTVAPTITLIGENPLVLLVNATYTDPGYSASDDTDGDITDWVVVVGGNAVDTATPGSYTVTHDVTDAAGNPAERKTRVVNVSDADGPIFSNVPANFTVEATGASGAVVTYTLPTATDALDGVVTVTCAPVSNTTLSLGAHTIACSASDIGGNDTSASFVATVVDTTAPVITLTGDATFTLAQGTAYTEPGVTAVDTVNGDLSGSITTTGTVDTAVAGTYTLTYSVTDGSGNNTSINRTLVVTAVSSGGSGGGGGGGGSSSSRTNRYAVTINNGATETKTTAVTLKISPAGNATEMQVSNTSNFVGVVWVPFRSTHKWTLAPGTGTKTVYVRYGKRDKVIGSANDSIMLVASVAGAPAAIPQVLGAASFQFTRDLTLGSYGTDVTELQKILIAGGHLKIAAPTGYYGVITAAAVRGYQAAHGLPVTGVVDATTRAVLNTGSTPNSNDAVKKALLLNELKAKLAELLAQLAALKTAE